MDSRNQKNFIEPLNLSIDINTHNEQVTILVQKKKRGRPRKVTTEPTPSKPKKTLIPKSNDRELSFKIEYSSNDLFSKFIKVESLK